MRRTKKRRNTKIKNKNMKYFLIDVGNGRRVFYTLEDAEAYCNKNGIDVQEIRSEDKKILKESKKVCRDVLLVLYDIKESMQEEYEQRLAEYRRNVLDAKASENIRDMDREYKRDRMNESYGVINGICKVQKIIEHQISLHESIINQ